MSSLNDFNERDNADAEYLEKQRILSKSRSLAKLNSKLAAELEEARKMLDKITEVNAADMAIPKWDVSPDQKDAEHATALLLLSDLHLDEVVDYDAMGGLNKYDREIAHLRLNAVINNTIKVLKHYVNGVVLDGIVVALIGDIITGAIHEELERTNEAPVPATISHWIPYIAAGLVELADATGKVHVVCIGGNHDRMYKRLPHKERAESSYSWLIYNWLADTLRDDERITFSIPKAAQVRFDIYSTRFMASHGDGFRSAGGIGGLYPSLLKWVVRQHAIYSAVGDDFDVAIFGHWHQFIRGRDFFGNGTLKGFDEYAFNNGFTYEPAQQALAIVSPTRGITSTLPIFAEDQESEGWVRRGQR